VIHEAAAVALHHDLEAADHAGDLERALGIDAIALGGEVLLERSLLLGIDAADEERRAVALGGLDTDAGDGGLAPARAPPPAALVGGLGRAGLADVLGVEGLVGRGPLDLRTDGEDVDHVAAQFFLIAAAAATVVFAWHC
jgi:hypothetical protein